MIHQQRTPVEKPFHLNPFQEELVNSGMLDTGFNLVIQAPTGSGKTWMAKELIKEVIKSGGKAVFLTPLRALASELHENWSNEFQNQTVGIFTGDFGVGKSPEPKSFKDSDLLIMTPERLDACTRFWRQHWHWLPQVDLVIVDEIHLLNDQHRGPRLEGTLSRIQRLNPFTRIIMLSATMGNLHELASWIDGVAFQTFWRPVKLQWKYCFYKKSDEKPEILFRIVSENIQANGQSLVFVQSRRRAIQLAATLKEKGLISDAHHAGFDPKERSSIEKSFRERRTQVLVTTSTLEMGLNLPARQVVLYDLQEYNGQDFVPLSTISVWQRGGRAGRPGQDPLGEVVIIAPTWQKGVKDYERGQFEKIESRTNEDLALNEQILVEISTRLSRNETQVTRIMKKSIARKQITPSQVNHQIEQMIEAGFLLRIQDSQKSLPDQFLKATRLGRVAIRHMLAPSTVQLINSFVSGKDQLTFFDIALIISLTVDCQPIHPVDFETLSSLRNSLRLESSSFLQNPEQMLQFGLRGKRVLSGLKMASVMREWTRFGNLEELADTFNLYPFEIRRLLDSAQRVLQGWIAMVDLIAEPENDPDEQILSLHEKLTAFITMLNQGINEEQVSLTFVDGIGAKWAKKLISGGVNDIEELAMSDPSDLMLLGGLKDKRAHRWIAEAEKLVKDHSAFWLKEMRQENDINKTTEWNSSIDPYRLRRSIDLDVAARDESNFIVSGGLEPHKVHNSIDSLVCDCKDFGKGHHCKHVLAVEIHSNKPEILSLLNHFKQCDSARGLNLENLWYG